MLEIVHKVENNKSTLKKFRERHITPRKLGMLFWSMIRGIMIVGIAYYILYPLIVKISLAFMDKSDIHDITVSLIPRHFTLDNIKLVFNSMEYPKAFMNSTALALGVTILQLISCTLVGYGFARFKFKGRGLLFGLVIFTLLVPPQVIMAPLYMQFRYFDIAGLIKLVTGKEGLNLINTPWPFILNAISCTGIRNGLYIYMIRQFFRGVPREIEEAALVDGASIFKTFYKVMLPSAKPIMSTVFLFSFVWQWNDLLFTGWYLDNVRVLPIALDTLSANIFQYITRLTGNSFNPDPAYVILLNSTGCMLVILPLVLLYIFTQRYFVEGVERAGIVG